MTHNLMISYSRKQTPFVNRFYQELKKAGHSIWLDYHSIVPAQPWLKQIHDGIDGADTLLLVISNESIASVHVLEEWVYAVRKEKRIILVIFDAADLSQRPVLTEADLEIHPELRDMDTAKLTKKLREAEWVDFRLKYKNSLQCLKALLDGKEPQAKSAKKKSHAWGKGSPPEKGFKAPLTFWLAFLLSFLVVVSSILTWWTIFIPYVLAPLPLQIYKRNYSISRVIPALLFMPVFWFFTAVLLVSEGNILSVLGNLSSDTWVLLTPLFSWILLALLLTRAMQRRAHPEAAIVRFARKNSKDSRVRAEAPEPVPYVIQHAPEDQHYAEALRRSLIKKEHIDATQEGAKPEAVFVLLSPYNKETSYNPDDVPVFPILLQAVKGLAPNLGRIQWIDFRRGIRQTDRLAQLLDKPKELLEEVGIAPTGAQEIFPLVVNALQYFFLLTGILGGGGLLLYLASFVQLLFQQQVSLDGDQFLNMISLAFLGGVLLFAVLYAVRAVRTRQGGTAGIYPLLVLTLIQTAIQLSLMLVSLKFGENEILYKTADSIRLPAVGFVAGLVIVLPFVLFGWRELYRWLPTPVQPATDKLERALLLYTPLQRRRLVYHVLFHAGMILVILSISFSLSIKDTGAIYCLVLPFLLGMLGVRWLAWRSERKTATALAAKAV